MCNASIIFGVEVCVSSETCIKQIAGFSGGYRVGLECLGYRLGHHQDLVDFVDRMEKSLDSYIASGCILARIIR